MTKFFIVTETENSSPYALVVHNSINVKSYPLSRSADEWAHWVNNENHEITEIVSSLGLNLEYGDSQPVTTKTLEPFKNVLPESVYDFVKTLSRQPTIEFTDNVRGYGRRYVVNSDVIHRKRHQRVETKNLIPSVSTNILKRQAYIDRKAMTFRSDNTFSELAFNLKAARAMWDPDLGPSGGWRCPKGSRYGGYITDRFGRGCGGGIIRRVGRALVNAGRGLDNLADRRDRRRLNRAAQRAAKPRGGGNRAERVAQGLERGARRVLGGEEIQTDVANRRVRRNIDRPKPAPQRRGAILPGGGQGVLPRDKPVPQRRGENFVPVYNTIDDELKALDEKLNNLGLGYYSPKQIREMKDRKLHLEEEKRKLGGGAKPPPKRVPKDPVRDFFEERAREEQIPIDGRDPYGRVRPQRRPGSRPVRRPVTENRGRGGEVERRVRPRPERGQGRYAPGWQPGEYKPGDKDRIAQRENRYAKVSTDQLYRALELNAPRDLKPGESADVEARRRQERLEILQELINRDLDIPERYKREAKIYRLKKQRKQGAKPKRNERVARALERAARRIVGGEGGRSREERRQRRMERRAERRERVARALERGAERLVGGDREPRRERAARAMERGAERLVGEDEKRPRSQRERARSAVVEQAQRSPVRKPQRKRRDAAFDALVGKDQLDDDFRELLFKDLMDLENEWKKRLGVGLPTREAMDKYIADREGQRAPAFIGALKAKANDWDVLREFFAKDADAVPGGPRLTPEQRLEILGKLGPTRKRKLRERMAEKIPAPKSRSERTPSRLPTPKPESRRDRFTRIPTRPPAPSVETGPAVDPLERKNEIARRLNENPEIMRHIAVRGELIAGLAERWPDMSPEDVERAIVEVLKDIDKRELDLVKRYNAARAARHSETYIPWKAEIQYGPRSTDAIDDFRDVMDFDQWENWELETNLRIAELQADLDRRRANLGDMSASDVADLMDDEAALGALFAIRLDAAFARQKNDVYVGMVNRFEGELPKDWIAEGEKRANRHIDLAQDVHFNKLKGLLARDARGVGRVGPSEILDAFDDFDEDDKDKVLDEIQQYLTSLEEELSDKYKINRDILLSGGLEAAQLDVDWLGASLKSEDKEKLLEFGAAFEAQQVLDKERDEFEILKAALERRRRMGGDRLSEGRTPDQPASPASAVRGLDSAMSEKDQRIARPPAGFMPDGMMPQRAERRLPKQRYANLDAAIQHLHRDGGSVADIPDNVLFEAMIYDAVDQYGNPLDSDVFRMGFPGGEGSTWGNARFEGENIKDDTNAGYGLWQVHRITDKQTGEVWYLKTSGMGVHDGLNEAIGAAIAESVGFGLNIEDVRVGEIGPRFQAREGRWIMMRDVAQMDAGSDLDGAPGTWRNAVELNDADKARVDVRDVARMLIIDFIMHNQDRHVENFMLKEDKNGNIRIAIIDHGLVGAGRAPNFQQTPIEMLDTLIARDFGIRDYGRDGGMYAFNNAIKAVIDRPNRFPPAGLGWVLKDAQDERVFREQVIAVVQHLRDNLDQIVSQRILEAAGLKLTPEEKRYFDRYRQLMKQRLDKLEDDSELDELVTMLF